jgi:Argonaute siRNA chaperone (ARC) complex subunit Arb1
MAQAYLLLFYRGSSFYFPDYSYPESLEMIKMGTNTIRNWLNYLLFHEVLPEYTDNIKAARKYCDLAEKQLWDNIRLLSAAPGNFNKASSFLFAGYYHDLPATAQTEQSGAWGGEKFEHVPMTADVAHKVVLFALACSGSDEQAGRYVELSNSGSLRANPIRDIDGFEVVDIVLPNAGVREFYSSEAPDLNPVGKVRGKAWRNPSEGVVDLAPGETLPDIEKLEFEFFVEEDLLQYFYLGMKIVTTVWELNCGIFYYDEILTAYCSFYTTLLNDLMLGWKSPRELKGERGDEGKEEATGEAGAVENDE